MVFALWISFFRKRSDFFTSFVKFELSNQTKKTIAMAGNENYEDVEKIKMSDDEIIMIKKLIEEPIYLGPFVSGRSLIEKSKQFKLNSKIQLYNLENDNLFGKPLNTKLIRQEKSTFELNNFDFYNRFQNCTGGKIKIEKKLSPNICTGWTTHFNDGDNVEHILKSISSDIEHSSILNIENLKCGMLVGAFDSATNLYGRGYITLISGNSVNVAMSDYGRVINTIKIRTLPEQYTKLPAYSFKVYTKGNYVSQLEDKPYVFSVRSACAERIVLIIFDENKEIKVQLKKWYPTIEESGVPYIEFKRGSLIKLLSLKDMKSVYIRSKENRHVDFFFSSWNSLATYCLKNPQPLNRDPYYGEIIGFKSVNNNYVRGRVHKYLGDNIYSVKQMDNPIKENVKLSEMIELSFKHKSMPVCMLKVELKDAFSYPIQFDAKNFVNFLFSYRLSVNFDESSVNGWRYVELIMARTKENLNAILFYLVEPSWMKDIPVDLTEGTTDFLGYKHLLKNELKEKSIVNMTFVMYHNGIFYMRDKLFGKYFSLLSDMIIEYCSFSLHSYLPHIGEVCLGKYLDGMWYRIVCDEIKPGELAKVHFIDLGIVACLNSRNMKKCPIDLLFHPIHVYQCILDAHKIDVKKIDLLQNYENTDCEFTIVNNLDVKNRYTIKCPILENIIL